MHKMGYYSDKRKILVHTTTSWIEKHYIKWNKSEKNTYGMISSVWSSKKVITGEWLRKGNKGTVEVIGMFYILEGGDADVDVYKNWSHIAFNICGFHCMYIFFLVVNKNVLFCFVFKNCGKIYIACHLPS